MTPDSKDLGAQTRARSSDAIMETFVGYVLRFGVALSTALLIAGFVWRWWATGSFRFDYTIPHMNLYEFALLEIQQIAAGAFRPRLLVSLGIAVLLVTPYLRVFASMVYFALIERDLKYTLFTAFVFAVLTYSLLLR